MIGKVGYIARNVKGNPHKRKVKVVGDTKYFYICAFINNLGDELYRECFYPEEVEVK